jgi:hypothetical protein
MQILFIIIQLIFKCINSIIDFTQDSFKSVVATTSGSVAGYTPNIIASIENSKITSTDVAFQHAVWTVTLIIGVFAIINAIQKQVDRYKKKKKQKEDEDNMESLD